MITATILRCSKNNKYPQGRLLWFCQSVCRAFPQSEHSLLCCRRYALWSCNGRSYLDRVYYDGCWWDLDVTNDISCTASGKRLYGFHDLTGAYASDKDYYITNIYWVYLNAGDRNFVHRHFTCCYLSFSRSAVLIRTFKSASDILRVSSYNFWTNCGSAMSSSKNSLGVTPR